MTTPQRPIPAAADLYGDLLDIGPVAKLGWRSYVPGLLMAGVAALAAAYLSEHLIKSSRKLALLGNLKNTVAFPTF